MNVVDNAKITAINGDFKIDSIHFRKMGKSEISKNEKDNAYAAA